MTTETVNLHLSGESLPVMVEDYTPGVPAGAADAAVAQQLLQCTIDGSRWPADVFSGMSAEAICEAIVAFTILFNNHQHASGGDTFDALELDALVQQQAADLPDALRQLAIWCVLVRIGATELKRDLGGLVAILPMPPHGSVSPRSPTEDVGRTHYTVVTLAGGFASTGFVFTVSENGWQLGGAAGCRWRKGLWMTPGLRPERSVFAVLLQRMGYNMREGNAPQAIVEACTTEANRIMARRAAQGITGKFEPAYGMRLDLENTGLVSTTLACVRALVAHAILTRENRTLDQIAERHVATRDELVDNVECAGSEAVAAARHIARRARAYAMFKGCGSVITPIGYIMYSRNNLPVWLSADTTYVEVHGRDGIGLPSHALQGLPIDQLLRHAGELGELEDLTPLIDACGVYTLEGVPVSDIEVIGAETAADVVRVEFTCNGERLMLPYDAFVAQSRVVFMPMVINYRRRIESEDLRGCHRGVDYSIGSEEARKFRCPPRSKRS